jgi:UDP-N-acetylmuramoylalanine--D-glutamate ligase
LHWPWRESEKVTGWKVEGCVMKTNWTGKQVVVIGAARQGTALARYLCQHGADVIISDQKRPDQLAEAIISLNDLPVRWKLNGSPLKLLDNCDLLCPSGGVPLELPIVVEAHLAK